MAQYSLNTSMIQRSAGSSAVVHVAYITAAKIVDLRTGQEANYTRREGVLCPAPEIVLPAEERKTQSAKVGRGQLWNMAEAAEKRKDGNPARKVLVALPHELVPEQRLTMTQQYAQPRRSCRCPASGSRCSAKFSSKRPSGSNSKERNWRHARLS